ncbi:MAG: hypothetical protein KAS12_01195 [Candidatus Aenigmarchaeota archaeon]|nr:hypothetical protein [Candidatus Aenigmarchaeota archaeon]
MVKVEKAEFITDIIPFENKLYYKPQTINLILSDTNTATVNAIRRTVIDETKTKRLIFDIVDMKSDDRFFISDFIQERIRSIPIEQNIPIGARFSLDYRNDTEKVQYVHANHIIGKTTRKICNDEFILFSINPGKYIKISNMYIIEDYGFNNGTHNASYMCRFKPIDIVMEDHQSANIQPRKFAITIKTNGEMDNKVFLKKCLDELIVRVKNINLDNLESLGENHTLKIYSETYSIGNLISNAIIDIYPQVAHVSPTYPQQTHSVFINITHHDREELINILQKAKTLIVGNFEKIVHEIQ